MEDPRVRPVEDNLLAFWTSLSAAPMFRREPVDDVTAVHSEIAFPMFNAATGARFGDDAERRTHEVVDSFVAAGLPWMWWLTPSTTSPTLEAVLEARGLEREPVPGMHCSLDDRPDGSAPAGVEIRQTGELQTYLDVLVPAYGMPSFLTEPMGQVMRRFPEVINVVATLDGSPVATGTAYLTGSTAGIYNVAVLEHARGRGIGFAVTATVMNLAADAGADHAILHSTDIGQPVYERLGFVEVCQVPQYFWMPPED
jgi:ribosomal protein S18 acetylase RimI-like enzyme